MTWKRYAAGLILVLFLVAFGFASAIAGFLVLSSRSLVQRASTDAVLRASVLTRIRDGRQDEAIAMLESQLESDMIAHWAGFPLEDDLPEFWLFKRLPIGGLKFAADYLQNHPSDERDPLIDSISACHLTEDLPDPRTQKAEHRAQIRSCYGALR